MSGNSDFVIENGVLLEYKGPGGEVIIPEGVTEIPILRFEHCNHLTRVVLPESLQRINIRAFFDCINLKEVVISKNVSYIGEAAFDNCERLERIIVDEENETFRVQNGLLMAGTTVEACPGGLRGVCQIPEGTTRISSFAFSGCHRLTEIRIPDTVIGIGKSAFRQCVRLKRLTFPPKLKYILGRLCLDCEHLREIVLPESVKEIENAAFQHCGLLRVSLLGKAVKMDGYVFGEGNFSLFAPNFPLADLKPIYRLNAIRAFLDEEAAFSDERRAEYLKYIKTNRKKLLPTALEWPELLRLMLREEMLKPEEVERLVGETTAANRTELTAELLDYQNRIFPMEKRLEAQEKQLKRQARQLERELKQLESGELPEPKRPKLWRTGKDEKGNLILLGYKGEESEIEVPAVIGKDKVTAIGDYAFSPNGKPLSEAQRAVRRGIRSIRVPEGILTIGTGAFENCEGLERVELPASVRKIGGSSYLPDDYKPKPKKTDHPFSGCPALSAVLVAEGNRWYCMEGGLLFRKSRTGKKLLGYVGDGRGLCIVPEGTETIPNYFFQKCTSLKAVTIPESVTKIGMKAYSGCTSLDNVILPTGVTVIDKDAFSGCTSLTSVIIPEGVTKIGPSAFSGCTSLAGVDIPEGVTEIDTGAFSGCTSLTSVTIPASVTQIGPCAFLWCKNLTVHAPAGSYAQQYAQRNNIRFEEA
ncbi:leucine-rich repeat protein [Pseudoflavonifractor phocaeensis]|uniref:leucine-rich repeat protein n=1 Tax=Pseudoflavonifractor phocaeensis TaxID=1870988 RepID=UPI00195C34AB|nr:leucine-rich repeat protein [Pseudoflavonifractor phocaeensis]MBM6871433.1 leucine-rich repeat protein [Pseudoflavonifractor phocaeensis]